MLSFHEFELRKRAIVLGRVKIFKDAPSLRLAIAPQYAD
jgi:hypothetical protein